jgi:hypothetical protein
MMLHRQVSDELDWSRRLHHISTAVTSVTLLLGRFRCSTSRWSVSCALTLADARGNRLNEGRRGSLPRPPPRVSPPQRSCMYSLLLPSPLLPSPLLSSPGPSDPPAFISLPFSCLQDELRVQAAVALSGFADGSPGHHFRVIRSGALSKLLSIR